MLNIGNLFTYCSPGESAPDNRLPLYIYPKDLTQMNFASGYGDPSTSLMIKWLEAQPVSGKVVCDRGTGTGIVAVAAAKLGAKVIATDIAKVAHSIANAHFSLNEVTVEYLHQPDPVKCDYLTHNIPDEPLSLLVEALALCRVAAQATISDRDLMRLEIDGLDGWKYELLPYVGEGNFTGISLWR